MKNIVLVGLMGAGKTTIGKELAKQLSYKFADTDELIEQQENCKITDIFSDKGEEYFRNLENKICKKLSGKENLIISTGGGMIQNIDNFKKLQVNGFIVYLQASHTVLYDRIKQETHRPLLKTHNPLEKLSDLLKTREKNYKLANFSINTENMSIEEITTKIIKEYHANS